ncbi:MAG: NFACT family protein, partial [Fusobacteriaceae bacterium]
MLYLDGISLNKIKEELERELVGKKIGKITQETELSVSIFFGRMNLVISAAATLPICYISEDKNLKLDESFNFLLSLKKYLQNGSLEKIDQIGFDRILCFKFKKMDFLGDVNNYNLYFEIMGKHSNLILTDEKGRILDLMKRFSLEENKARLLFPGAQYELPNIEKKKNPSDLSKDEFQEIKNDVKGFISFVEGVGKFLVQNLRDYNMFREILESGTSPCCYLKNGKIVLATVLKGLAPKEFDKRLEIESFSQMITYYIEKNHMTNSQEKLFQQISSTIKKRLKKLERILGNIKRDNLEKEDYEINKE